VTGQQLQESTVYDNCVGDEFVAPPPLLSKGSKPDYPKTLKVHINSREDCDAFE